MWFVRFTFIRVPFVTHKIQIRATFACSLNTAFNSPGIDTVVPSKHIIKIQFWVNQWSEFWVGQCVNWIIEREVDGGGGSVENLF